MAKIVVTNNGLVQQELSIVKARTNIGRRPNNDLILEQLTVSGQHAAIEVSGKDVYLTDVGSTNGTLVNGQKITKHLLQHQDMIEIGTYKIKYFCEPESAASSDQMLKPAKSAVSMQPAEILAKLKVLSGSNLGREMTLSKPVTMLGSAGILVVSISRENQQYFIKHVDGKNFSRLNDEPLQATQQLKDGDIIDLAGTRMKFYLRSVKNIVNVMSVPNIANRPGV